MALSLPVRTLPAANQPVACGNGQEDPQTWHMSEDAYAKGGATKDLRTHLTFWPQIKAEGENTRQNMKADKNNFLTRCSIGYKLHYAAFAASQLQR